MFWNDPNLYSVAFKDVPNFPLPFYGQIPRFFNPWAMMPPYYTPPVTPNLFTPQFPPTFFTPPVNPYLQTPPVTPFVNPMINPTQTPFNFTHPFFQGYRPFGL